MNAAFEKARDAAGLTVSRAGSLPISSLGKVDMLLVKERLVFVLREPFLSEAAKNAGISAVIVPPALADAASAARGDWTVLTHDAPMAAFWDLHHRLVGTDFYPLHTAAPKIDPSAKVSPHAVIEEGVVIGAGSVVEAFAIVKKGSVLGKNVRIGSHAIVGREGYEKTKVKGVQTHVTHVGNVILGDGVMIDGHSSIDRAIWGSTVVGEGTHIDNLCHIGHACQVGRNNLITAGTIFGGVLKVGDDNFFGMNCTIKQNLTIGSRCRIAMHAIVLHSLPDDTKLVVTGSPTDRELLAQFRQKR